VETKKFLAYVLVAVLFVVAIAWRFTPYAGKRPFRDVYPWNLIFMVMLIGVMLIAVYKWRSGLAVPLEKK